MTENFEMMLSFSVRVGTGAVDERRELNLLSKVTAKTLILSFI